MTTVLRESTASTVASVTARLTVTALARAIASVTGVKLGNGAATVESAVKLVEVVGRAVVVQGRRRSAALTVKVGEGGTRLLAVTLEETTAVVAVEVG